MSSSPQETSAGTLGPISAAPGRHTRVALRIEHDVPCPDCGYNLHGLRLDGRCPECGRPTIDTFARPLRANTGVLAEEMIRRSGKILLTLLGWWIAVIWLSARLPPSLGFPVTLAAGALAGASLLVNLIHAIRLRRRALGRSGGSSKPLQDAASWWLLLCGIGVAGGMILIAMTTFAGASLPPLVRLLLAFGSAGSAAGSHALAAQAATTVLRRLALSAPAGATVNAGAAALILIAACTAPAAGLGQLEATARSVVGLAALAAWWWASHRVIGKLREAQGSVVSIGRSSRR